ncbi:antirestriction protein ArdA [Sulfuricurvum sp.]|uniref:antirestriction protein ArdA n=1 Tax=Sulfuricurvum sp. TaxID=2025608 RepID=UPI00260C32C5|nr:antirestriction protein ArdA [Sulfuricurvum sp.]MDD3597093.1 antirestriction protein ArdA [Sulfuricurvum sp.]
MVDVFITDLSAYNNGFLVGEWVSLPLDSAKLTYKIREILAEGQLQCKSNQHHTEWFITDYEGTENFTMTVDEYTNIYALNDQLSLLEFKSDYELKAISFLLGESLAIDIEDAISKVDDVIVHENQNMEDLAYDLLQDCYGVDQLPSIISNHIDYQQVAKSLEYDGCYYEVGNDIYEYVG